MLGSVVTMPREASTSRGTASPATEYEPTEYEATQERRRELDDRIGELAAQAHAIEAELVGALAELVELGGADGIGYQSTAHWLSVRTKYTMRDARELVLLAERAGQIESLLADGRAGQLSVGVLAVAARLACGSNIEALRDTLRVCTPTQAVKVLRTYRVVADDKDDAADNADDTGGDDGRPEFVEPGSSFGHAPETWWHRWTDDQGRYRLDAALDATTGALLEAARDAARASCERPSTPGNSDDDSSGDCGSSDDNAGDGSTPRPSLDNVIAELAAEATHRFDSDGFRHRGGDRFRVQVTCDLETLAAAMGITLDPSLPVRFGSRAYVPATGAHLTDAQLARLSCESDLQVLVHHDGEPLWLGRRRRLFSPVQRRALFFRAEHQCEFPGCTSTRWLDAHHLQEFSEGGPTDIDNGVVVCPAHHREIHRRGWTARRRRRRLEWFDERGRPIGLSALPTVDEPPPPLPGIEPDTPRSTGGGEPLTAYGLDVLLNQLFAA